MQFSNRRPASILAAALMLSCGLASAQATSPAPATRPAATPASQPNPTPASQSNPTPAGTPAPTSASTPNPTPASNATPTPASRPSNAQNAQQQSTQPRFPANQQQSDTAVGGGQQNAATRCATLTGIPKAECERRDSTNTELPAGRTQSQAQKQAQREAEANQK